VNKENLLFGTVCLLVGFIAGYLLHEVMVARQPLRRAAGETGVVTAPPAGDDGSGPGGGGGAGEQPQAVDGAQSGAGSPAGGGADGPAGAGAQGAAPGAGGAPATPPMAAIQQLRDHVASHPDDADAVLKLADLNFDIQSWGRARDLYIQYLALRPSSPDVLTDLGNCYRELKDYDSALRQFHRAEELAPSHWKSLFSEVVTVGFDLNHLDQAEKLLPRLQAIAPQQPEVVRLAAEMQRRRAAG
jgi:hypothetical protein